MEGRMLSFILTIRNIITQSKIATGLLGFKLILDVLRTKGLHLEPRAMLFFALMTMEDRE